MGRPFWAWTLGLCWWAAMCWILGKYSTRIPSALRQLCPKICTVVNLSTNSTCFPKQYSMLGSDSPFQDITQNMKIHKPLHAIDWWLLHHWPKIICFHEESCPKISSDCPTINFPDMSNICFIVRYFPVFLMARGAGIHGDVLNLHTEAFLSLHTEVVANSVYQKKNARMVITCFRDSPKIFRSFPFEKRSRTTCSRFLQSFALSDKAEQFQQSWRNVGRTRREMVRFV